MLELYEYFGFDFGTRMLSIDYEFLAKYCNDYEKHPPHNRCIATYLAEKLGSKLGHAQLCPLSVSCDRLIKERGVHASNCMNIKAVDWSVMFTDVPYHIMKDVKHHLDVFIKNIADIRS